MSFYSYKNANADIGPGAISGSALEGLSERICVQVKNVYDSCLQQEQLDRVVVTVQNIVPVLPNGCGAPTNRPCNCTCAGNQCTCTCGNCGEVTYEDAVENAENAQCLPQPYGAWTFESCRSSTTAGEIQNLTIDRLCDRPQFARVRGSISIPIDVLFIDQNCQEWMGQASLSVNKDVLLAIPDESIVPFTLESLVSAICVTGKYIGSCRFEITICVTIVLKILAEVELMIPSYGFCEVPPCEEFAENVCDEFFSLPLFPQQAPNNAVTTSPSYNTCGSGCGTSCGGCGSASCGGYGASCGGGCGGTPCGGCGSASCSGCVSGGTAVAPAISTCSNCGTTVRNASSQCPRCGSRMTATVS